MEGYLSGKKPSRRLWEGVGPGWEAALPPDGPPFLPKDEAERHPPDEVVGQECEAGDPRQLTPQRRVEESDRAEDLAEQPDQHDGPVPHGVEGGDGVADAV